MPPEWRHTGKMVAESELYSQCISPPQPFVEYQRAGAFASPTNLADDEAHQAIYVFCNHVASVGGHLPTFDMDTAFDCFVE